MSDRSIIFQGPMVRGLLREIEHPGTGKTQTRRIIKPLPWNRDGDVVDISIAKSAAYIAGSDGRMYFQFEHPGGGPLTAHVAKINVGDRLWVREGHYLTDDGDFERAVYAEDAGTVAAHKAAIAALPPYFSEELKARHLKLRPSIHMPRWASRITLYVTEVRVQRLQDISEANAIAEGVTHDSDGWCDYLMPSTQCFGTARDAYRTLWDAINGPGAWEANPFVAAYTFVPRLGNVDRSPATLAEAAHV